MELRTVIGKKILIGEGAMGTLQINDHKGIDVESNIKNPDHIRNFHSQYIAAGADIIQSNTYGANAIKLASYGLEDFVEKINVAGVELAKQARGDKPVFILGTIGGVFEYGVHDLDFELVMDSFEEQLRSLLKAKPDGILLETFFDFKEAQACLRLAKSMTDLPIFLNLSIREVGVLASGISINEAFQELAKDSPDVLGLNCSLGPYLLSKSFEQVAPIQGITFAVYPNASFPTLEEGRITYLQQVEYFKKYAGVFQAQGIGVIGGCCGTTPRLIEAYCEGLKTRNVMTPPPLVHSSRPLQPVTEVFAPDHHQQNHFLDRVRSEVTVIAEVDPPRHMDIEGVIKGAKYLSDAGIDAISLSDNPLASSRVSNLALASILHYEHNIQPIVHLTTRDHNLIGLNSHIMGYYTIGVRDFLVITGDPAKVGDFPGAKSVFDLTSKELIKLIHGFNTGIDYTGRNMKKLPGFKVAAAFNPNVNNLLKRGSILRKKQEAGANYIVTQPVFDPHTIEDLHTIIEEQGIHIPVFVGVIPLMSARNAEFLHNEVPGIKVNEKILSRMIEAEKDGRGKAEGEIIAQELIELICKYFKGVSLITPFSNYEIIGRLGKFAKTCKTMVVNDSNP